MTSESFKVQLNSYIEALVSDAYEEREMRKEFPKPKVPRHDIYFERHEKKSKPVRRHHYLGESD